MNRKTYDELIKARDEGQLKAPSDFTTHAPLFVENEQLADPESKSGAQFQDYMQELTSLLLRNEKWKPKAPVYFFLSQSDEENAYVVPGEHVNVMVFTRGVLKFLKNKDELAYILGHELGHIKIRDTYGTTKITKGEEAAADVLQVAWMHQAELNPTAGVNVMSRFWDKHEEEKKKFSFNPDILISLLDEHPNAALRPSIISNFIQGYARNEGVTAGFDPTEDEAFKFKPKDKQLTEILKRSKPFDYFAVIAKDAKYDRMPPLEQLAFIRDHVEDVREGFLPESRPQGLLRLIEACDCNGRDGQVQTVGKQIVAKLLAAPEAFNTCYGTVVVNTLDQDDKTPVEGLAPLKDAVAGIVSAKNKEELREHSRVLVEFRAKNPKLQLDTLNWPGFVIPSEGEIMSPRNLQGVPLPWNKQVKWANELAAEGDDTAQRALFQLGVEDKRLLDGAIAR